MQKTKVKVNMCLICGYRPRAKGSKYCQQCGGHIESEWNYCKPKEAKYYVRYREYAIAFMPNGKNDAGDQTYYPTPFYGTWNDNLRNVEKWIDLNRYVDGMTREQVKRLKKTVLRVHNVGVNHGK